LEGIPLETVLLI